MPLITQHRRGAFQSVSRVDILCCIEVEQLQVYSVTSMTPNEMGFCHISHILYWPRSRCVHYATKSFRWVMLLSWYFHFSKTNQLWTMSFVNECSKTDLFTTIRTDDMHFNLPQSRWMAFFLANIHIHL